MSLRGDNRFSHKDSNHDALTAVYESLGCTVVDTHTLGFGYPDANVGLVGITELVEFKVANGTQSPAQLAWCERWRGGKVRVVRCEQDVFDHVKEIRLRATRSESHGTRVPRSP